MNSFLTGKKLLFSAIFITGILFTTAFVLDHPQNQPGASQPAALVSARYESPDRGAAANQYSSSPTQPAQSSESGYALPNTDAQIAPVIAQIPTATPNPSVPSLESFINRVTNGQGAALVGLYVKNIMALQIVQQPDGDPAYIDRSDGTATQFSRAGVFGTIGLLAHNFLSGRHFFDIKPGEDLILVYGDGKTAHYTVSEIGDYQRLTPSDLRSDFLELSTHQKKSADQVFTRYYKQRNMVTLQTCIAENGLSDWGVRFIMARPSDGQTR